MELALLGFLYQLVHLNAAFDFLGYAIDHRSLEVVVTFLHEDFRAFYQPLDLCIHHFLRVILNCIDSFKVGLARIRRHPVECRTLLVLVQEVLALLDMCTTFNERRKVARLTKQVDLSAAEHVGHGAFLLLRQLQSAEHLCRLYSILHDLIGFLYCEKVDIFVTLANRAWTGERVKSTCSTVHDGAIAFSER